VPFGTWEEAAEVLRRRIADPDAGQLALAQQLGVELPEAPALVAASALRSALIDPLKLQPPGAPRYGQMEFLSDLVEDLEIEIDELQPLDNENEASAWIDVLRAKRSLRALEEKEPMVGDVVDDTFENKVGQISSFSSDGRVNIRGLWGRGIDAHRLRIRARANEQGEEADRLRREADNLRAQRAVIDGPPSEEKLAVLENFRPPATFGSGELELLREAIEQADDERPIQACLATYPQLLGTLIPGSYGTFVLPQVRLGADLVPDFLLAKADSAGLHWTLVELESPTAPVAINDGSRLAQKSREAVQQIEDWKNWLTNNLAYARDELNLADIRPESESLILIGRRGGVPALSRDQLRSLRERGIALHSYDWLLEAVELSASAPGSALEWTFLADRF